MFMKTLNILASIVYLTGNTPIFSSSKYYGEKFEAIISKNIKFLCVNIKSPSKNQLFSDQYHGFGEYIW